MTTVAKYCERNRLIIPQALFAMKEVTVLMKDGDSCIVYKKLAEDLQNVEFYTNTACVIYLKEGQETITTSENKSYDVAANTAIFLPQGVNLHSDYVQATENLRAYLVFFDDDVVAEYLLGIKQRQGQKHREVIEPGPLLMPCNSSIAGCFESVQTLCRDGMGSKGLLRIKLLELLYLFSALDDGQFVAALGSKKSSQQPKRNLQRLLRSPDAFRLTINDLAHLSGRSISSFGRDFKLIYDQSPKQWMQEKRLAHAHELLTGKSLSVTQVALDVGYENISHFIQAFREKYGITPKKLKQQV